MGFRNLQEKLENIFLIYFKETDRKKQTKRQKNVFTPL